MNIKLKAVIGVAFAGYAFAVSASTWTFNGSNSIANDDNTWAFPVTCSGTDLTISGKPSKGSSGTLDLSGVVTDTSGTEYHIVAFSGKQHLYSNGTVKNITLPATLLETPIQLCDGCSNLESATFPAGSVLTKIGDYTFRDCSKLSFDLSTIPSTVTVIGQDAFNGCKGLTGELNLKNCPNLTTIGNSAFKGCTGLTKVDLSSNGLLTSIGNDAFNGCTAITEIFVGAASDSELTVCQNCFKDCTALKTATFGASLKTVQVGMLACPNVTTIRFLGPPPGYLGTGRFWSGSPSVIPPYKARMYVPESAAGTGWRTASGYYKAWDQLTPEVQAEYTSRFPDEPHPDGIGVSTDAEGYLMNQWVIHEVPTVKKAVFTVENSLGDTSTGTPTPGYGIREYDIGTTVDCSIEQYGTKGTVLYEAYESVFSEYDASTETFENPVTNAGRSVSVTLATEGTYKLTWNFRVVGYKPTVTVPTALVVGRVTETSTPDFTGGYYLAGKTATYTAEALNGATFVKWTGDVPAGQESQATINVLVDGAKTLKPYFKSTTLTMSGGRLSDGYYSMNTHGGADGDPLTLGYPNGNLNQNVGYPNAWGGVSDVIDLTIPIDHGRTLTAVGQHAFSRMGGIYEILFPATLTTIGFEAFSGSKNLNTLVFASDVEFDPDAFKLDGGAPAQGQILLVVPRTPGWKALVEDPARFTLWRNLPQSVKDKWTRGGKHPLGMTVEFGGQWLRYDKDPGFIVFLR